jgi:L-rhamnose mutarotase
MITPPRPAFPGGPVERVCFPGRIQPDRLAEYRRRHGEVWPEMLDARIDEIFHLD